MSVTVADELAKIKTFETETEKRRSTLTLNELNYISDKQLHKNSGGESSSPVGLAKVKFVADDLHMTLGSCFSDLIGLPAYILADEDYAETVGVYPVGAHLDDWNYDVDAGTVFLIAPCRLYKDVGNFTYPLEGDAEFGVDNNGEYIYIKGDCTITIEPNSSPQD